MFWLRMTPAAAPDYGADSFNLSNDSDDRDDDDVDSDDWDDADDDEWEDDEDDDAKSDIEDSGDWDEDDEDEFGLESRFQRALKDKGETGPRRRPPRDE